MFTTAVNGSYPRYPDATHPQLLRKAIKQYKIGAIDERGLNHAYERATVDAVGEMVTSGLDVISDGLIRRTDEISYIYERLGGFSILSEKGGNGRVPTQYNYTASSRIAWVRPIQELEYRFIAGRSPVEVRPVLTGPFSLARLCDTGCYREDSKALALDLARALNREIEGLENTYAGLVLIEEPLLTQNKDRIQEFQEVSEVLCRGVTLNLMLGTSGGDIVGIEHALLECPYQGFSFDLVEGTTNESVLSIHDLWEERIVQLGLIDAENKTIETPMEIALNLIKYSHFHDPGAIWVAPNRGLKTLSRKVAFQKLTNMCQGAYWARRDLARREEPGGNI